MGWLAVEAWLRRNIESVRLSKEVPIGIGNGNRRPGMARCPSSGELGLNAPLQIVGDCLEVFCPHDTDMRSADFDD